MKFIITKLVQVFRNRITIAQITSTPNVKSKYFEIDNFFVSKYIINRIIPIVGIHPFPLNELQLMVSTICRIRPKLIFDWGTHIGKSARIFSESALFFKIETTIHTIDLPPNVAHQEHPHEHVGRLIRKSPNVIQHLGACLDIIPQILQTATDSTDLLFFVDGDHSYESVETELAYIFSIAPNASILLHDTFFQDSNSRYNVGPYSAIQNFLALHQNHYQVISTQTGLPGMTLLYVTNTNHI